MLANFPNILADAKLIQRVPLSREQLKGCLVLFIFYGEPFSFG
jgi:hypothetical protein